MKRKGPTCVRRSEPGHGGWLLLVLVVLSVVVEAVAGVMATESVPVLLMVVLVCWWPW